MRAAQQAIRKGEILASPNYVTSLGPLNQVKDVYGPAASRGKAQATQHQLQRARQLRQRITTFTPEASLYREFAGPGELRAPKATLRDSIYDENSNRATKSKRTPPRLSLPAEREGNLTKRNEKNTKPITIKKGIGKGNGATGRQNTEPPEDQNGKSWRRKPNNPKGKKRKENGEKERTGERGHAIESENRKDSQRKRQRKPKHRNRQKGKTTGRIPLYTKVMNTKRKRERNRGRGSVRTAERQKREEKRHTQRRDG